MQEGVSLIKVSADINKLVVLLLILRTMIKDTVLEGKKVSRTAKLKDFHNTMSLENSTCSKLLYICRCVEIKHVGNMSERIFFTVFQDDIEKKLLKIWIIALQKL